MSFKKSLLGVAAAAAVAAPGIAAAQLSANIGLVTDYRFRGISQTYSKPALQGGVDYAHSSGFYVGTWLSTVSGNLYPYGSHLEWDLYGGYKWEPVKDLSIDVGILNYAYPGARYHTGTGPRASANKFDNTELYLGLSYKWFSAKYSHSVTNYFGINTTTYGGYCGFNSNGTAPTANCIAATPGGSKGSGYLDLNANFEIMDKTTLGLHLGHTSVRHYGPLSYSDWKISLSREFSWATLSAAYVDTNARAEMYRYGPSGLYATPQTSTANKDPGKGTLVLSILKTF